MVEPSALQKYSLFGGLLEDQIEMILPLMKQETYPTGTVIIREGEPNDRIFFILEGKVEVVKERVQLYVMNEGDTFGEMEVLDVMPSAADIRTLVPTRAMYISNRALREVYKSDLKVFSLLIMNLARDLSRRLRNMDSKVVEDEAPSLD
jgi:CRP-like cAMP-binding protein